MLTLEATQTLRGLAESATTLTVTVHGDESAGDADNDFKVLYQGQLAATVATLYTAPASHQTLISTISVRNTGASIKWFELLIGGTAAVNSWVKFNIPANGLAEWTSKEGWKVFNADGQVSLVGSTGATGAQGTTGATGPDGVSVGYQYKWATSTANTDPTSGYLKFNNATFASVTALYISETDNLTNVLSAVLATWDDSTSTIRARVKITKKTATQNFWLGTISATLTDNGTWDTFTVAHIASAGSFSAEDILFIYAVPTGDKGDTGTTGNTGNTGAVGAVGNPDGFKFLWDSTDTTITTVATGKIKVNNATPASVTSMGIFETDANSINIAAFLQQMDDSTTAGVKSYLTLANLDGTKRHVYSVSAVVDSGTYDTITVAAVSNGSVFSNGEAVWIAMSRTGDIGSTGNTGGTGATGPSPAGQIYLSAAGMWPRTTNPCADATLVEMATNKQNVYVLDFDGTTSEYAQCMIVMPSDWNAGVITAKFLWMVNAAVTTAVVWGISGGSYGDNEALDAAFGTEITVADTAIATSTNKVFISAATGNVTIANAGASEFVMFQTRRLPADAGDTMSQDARLLGVMITYTRT